VILSFLKRNFEVYTMIRHITWLLN